MRREFVIFDVASDLAHFRRQYAITTALTYPVPPRTALCGLVGAVLGLPKNESLAHFQDSEAVFGLQILSPLRTGYVSINLVDTKQNPSFRLKAVNPRTTVRYEVLRQPRYRVMFSHPSLARQLAESLKTWGIVLHPLPGTRLDDRLVRRRRANRGGGGGLRRQESSGIRFACTLG